MKRVESLDYLRGLLAVAVMGYHYASWSVGEFGAESVLGRLGIYAVSTFFVLSGLSLGIVYQGRIVTTGDLGAYAIKRVFRIAPLFWIVITLTILAAPSLPPAVEIIQNYTLTFGFLAPSHYFSAGAWSIGTELVLYGIFPLAVMGNIRWWLWGSIAIGAVFAFGMYDLEERLGNQWRIYIDPLNHLFLFVAGIAMARGTLCANWSWTALLLLMAVSTAAFIFWPMEGDNIAQVTGLGRVAMSAACIFFVLALYRLNPVIKGSAGAALAFVGRGSYSIYLLHPLVGLTLAPYIGVGYVAAGAITLAVSWPMYRYVEAPMMRLGSRLARGSNAAMALTPQRVPE